MEYDCDCEINLNMTLSDKQMEILNDTEHNESINMLRGSGSTTAIVISALINSFDGDYCILVFGKNLVGFRNIIRNVFSTESEIFKRDEFTVLNDEHSITVTNHNTNGQVMFLKYRPNVLYEKYYHDNSNSVDMSRLFNSIYFDCVSYISENDELLLPYLVFNHYKKVYSIESPFVDGRDYCGVDYNG